MLTIQQQQKKSHMNDEGNNCNFEAILKIILRTIHCNDEM